MRMRRLEDVKAQVGAMRERELTEEITLAGLVSEVGCAVAQGHTHTHGGKGGGGVQENLGM